MIFRQQWKQGGKWNNQEYRWVLIGVIRLAQRTETQKNAINALYDFQFCIRFTQQQTIVYADWIKGNIYTGDFTCFLPRYFLVMRVSLVKRMCL